MGISHTLEDAQRSVDGSRELGDVILLSKCVPAECLVDSCFPSKNIFENHKDSNASCNIH